MENKKIEDLIKRANQIVDLVSAQNPRKKRYPEEVKSIVHSLVNQHQLSVSKITKFIPISNTSVKIWSGKKAKRKITFKKIKIQKAQVEFKVLTQIRNVTIALTVLQALETALILSLH